MTASCHDVAFNFFRAVLRILLSGLYLLEKLKLCVFSCATVSQLSRIQNQLSRASSSKDLVGKAKYVSFYACALSWTQHPGYSANCLKFLFLLWRNWLEQTFSGRYFPAGCLNRRKYNSHVQLKFLPQNLVFQTNIQKSALHPTQKVQFLGMKLNLVEMILNFSQEKKQILHTCQFLLKNSSVS